jgi:hypothetical protein
LIQETVDGDEHRLDNDEWPAPAVTDPSPPPKESICDHRMEAIGMLVGRIKEVGALGDVLAA